MRCQQCGTPQPEGARFCITCGLPVETRRAGQPAPVQSGSGPQAPPAVQPASADFPFQQLIPARNPPALIAYYLGVFSLVPCFAPLLGIPAVVFGIIGLRRAPAAGCGTAHAWIGILVGGFMFVLAIGLSIAGFIAIR